MVCFIRATSNYWACQDDEFLFELGQVTKSGYVIVNEHLYADQINTLNDAIKEKRTKIPNQTV